MRSCRACQVAREEGKPTLESEAPGEPATFRHDASVQLVARARRPVWRYGVNEDDRYYDNLSGQQAYKCFACRLRKA